MGKITDMIGKRYGFLTALSYKGKNKSGSMWECACDCGNTKTLSGSRLVCGRVVSCGCLRNININNIDIEESIRERIYINRLYNIYNSMKSRCYKKCHKEYHRYGGRGILICDRWAKFDNFRDDMYEKYSVAFRKDPKCQIDRAINDDGYSPDNCRFVSSKENNNNRCDSILNRLSKNQLIAIKENKDNLSYRALSRKYNISNGSIANIINNKT